MALISRIPDFVLSCALAALTGGEAGGAERPYLAFQV